MVISHAHGGIRITTDKDISQIALQCAADMRSYSQVESKARSRADQRESKMPMAKDKMTELEASAYCLFEAIQGASTFGKDQADKLKLTAQGLFAAGKIDPDVFGTVIMRFGNHSATRQRLEKYGWFARKVNPDALETTMRKLESEATDPDKQ